MIILIQVPPHVIYVTLDRSFNSTKTNILHHKIKVTLANSENSNQSKEYEGE